MRLLEILRRKPRIKERPDYLDRIQRVREYLEVQIELNQTYSREAINILNNLDEQQNMLSYSDSNIVEEILCKFERITNEILSKKYPIS